MKALLSTIVVALTGNAFPSVLFYSGDADGRGGLANEFYTLVTDARVYEDFVTPASGTGVWYITEIWSNNLIDRFLPQRARWEIRQGIRRNDCGTLVAQGEAPAIVTATGRNVGGIDELQVKVVVPASDSPVLLDDTEYFLMLAPVGQGTGRSFISETSAMDEGPAGDPNPPPTGKPLGNGHNFIDSTYFGINCEPAERYTGYVTDYSIGLSGEEVPEPPVIVSLLTFAAFAARRRLSSTGGR